MNQEFKDEVQRRTTELRSTVDRNSTPRRVIYLAAALQRMVDDYPKQAFPETWEVLDNVMTKFNRATAAMAIFDAEVIDDRGVVA